MLTTTRVPCADYFERRDQALLAHATQIDPDGFWFYLFHSHALQHVDLGLRAPPQRWPEDDPSAARRIQQILALYVTANALIEQNTLWSWRDFGGKL